MTAICWPRRPLRAQGLASARAGRSGHGEARPAEADRHRSAAAPAGPARSRRSRTKPAATCGSASTSASGRSSWCSATTSARCSARRSSTVCVSALSVLTFDVGREFDVVAVSINPKETPALAAQKKQAYMERYKRPHTAAGWHFLTGTEAYIQRLAAAVGFRYAFDEEIQQYAHAAVIEVLTPARGHLEILLRDRVLGARYQVRPDGGVGGAHRHGRSTAPCCSATTTTRRPESTARRRSRAVRIGAVATVLAFLSFLFVSLRNESGRRTGTRPCDR